MAPSISPDSPVRPCLKWAGGKTQLLREITRLFPPELRSGGISTYIEPFVGGGAVFFAVQPRYRFIQSVLCDANEDLVLCYRALQRSPARLVNCLRRLEDRYRAADEPGRRQLYYDTRDTFNREKRDFQYLRYHAGWIERAAQILFLNRTCYNGLFRMNRNGEFNVPFGKYKNPDILNEPVLLRAAKALETTRILSGDFTRCRKYADAHTFIYFDPPYRPLNPTSSFTSYARQGFSDRDQERLAKFFRDLDRKGAKLMLSNSDPRNEDPKDNFFEDLYADFHITRTTAKRIINCNGNRRGKIHELIITNYDPPGP